MYPTYVITSLSCLPSPFALTSTECIVARDCITTCFRHLLSQRISVRLHSGPSSYMWHCITATIFFPAPLSSDTAVRQKFGIRRGRDTLSLAARSSPLHTTCSDGSPPTYHASGDARHAQGPPRHRRRQTQTFCLSCAHTARTCEHVYFPNAYAAVRMMA